MNIERWIGSVINLSAVPCFGVCGNILAVSHNSPICTNFFTDCSTSIINCGKRVWSMLFSLLLYMILVSVLSAALFHVSGPPYRRDCCNCFTILHYRLVMNWWISGPVSLLTFQTKNLPATDNGNKSVLSCQSVTKVLKCFYCFTAPNLMSWFSGKSLELLPPDVRFLG